MGGGAKVFAENERMNATELRFALKSLGLSQRAAARALDVHERTMRRYAAAGEEIPRCVEYALRYLETLKRSPDA
jgi:DNA-binding transcriptional regulator YiaG